MQSVRWLATLAIVTLLCISAGAQQYEQNERGTEVKLDPNTSTPVMNKIQAMHPEVAWGYDTTTKISYAYAVWEDSRLSMMNKKDLYFSRSVNGGQSWSQEIKLNSSLSFDVDEWSIVCSAKGDRVYVTWEIERGLDSKSHVAVSSNYGQTFSAEKSFTGLCETDRNDAIFCSQDGLKAFVTLRQKPAGQLDRRYAYLVYTVNGGTSWSTLKSVTTDTSSASQTGVDVIGGEDSNYVYAHAIWEHRDNAGAFSLRIRTWRHDKANAANDNWVADGEKVITTDTDMEDRTEVSSSDGKTVHIFWMVNGTPNLLKHRCYYYNGTNWVLDGTTNTISDFIVDEGFQAYCNNNDLAAVIFQGQNPVRADPQPCAYTAKWTGPVSGSWSAPAAIVTSSPATHMVNDEMGLCGNGTTLWATFTYRDTTRVSGDPPKFKKHDGKLARSSRKSQHSSRHPYETTILKSKSTDGGANWDTATEVSTNSYWVNNLAIVAGQMEPKSRVPVYTPLILWDDTRQEGPHRIWAKNLEYSETPVLTTIDCPNKATSPVVLQRNDYVYSAWSDDRNWGAGIFFRRSTDKGKTWGTEKEISYLNGSSTRLSVNDPPAMCLDNFRNDYWQQQVYMVFAGRDNSNNYNIYFTSSQDNGATWSDPEIVCSNGNGLEYERWQKPFYLGAAAGNVYLVWCEERSGDSEIYFSFKPNGGSWTGPTCLSANMGIETELGTDGQYESYDAALGFDTYGNIYVTWADACNETTLPRSDIYVRRGLQVGGSCTWSTFTRLDTTTTPSFGTSLAMVNERVYVAWAETSEPGTSVYFRCFDGKDWSPAPVRLDGTPDTKNCAYPQVVANDTHVYATFVELASTKRNIYFNVSANFGYNFLTNPVLLNGAEARDRILPVMDIAGSNVWVAWMEEIGGKWQIYRKNSTNYGTTWGLPTVVNTTPTFQAVMPQMDCSNTYASFVWSDNRGGTWNIYYRSVP